MPIKSHMRPKSHNNHRTLAISVLRGLAAITASCCSAQVAAADKPNIIVIMADDLGYSDLACYGGEIETPYIDRLAQDGVRFTGFKNTARCAPSRASLLTGRYQHAVGVGRMTTDENRPGYRGQLSTEAPTLAEILRPHGYATGIVGKWHLTFTGKSETQKQLFPLDRGFDFYYGTWWGAKDYFSPQFMMKNREHLEDGNYPEDYYLTEDLSDSAIDFVESQSGRDRPFFLYLAHYAPHKPIQAPKERVYSETHHDSPVDHHRKYGRFHWVGPGVRAGPVRAARQGCLHKHGR